MHTVLLVLGIALLTTVAIGDVRSRRIPNVLVVGVLVLAVLRIALVGGWGGSLHTLAAGAMVLVATFMLFWWGWLGGGDAKLMTATSLLVGYQDLVGFLFVMSICGALVAIGVLAVNRLGLRAANACGREADELQARPTVPYGVAIAVAGVWTLLVQTSISG